MLTVNKQLINAALTLAFAGEPFEWHEMGGFENEEDLFVFKIEAPTTRLPHLFRIIYTIFPEHEVTLADDTFHSGKFISTEHEAIKLRGVSMEIGIRAPKRC